MAPLAVKTTGNQRDKPQEKERT